MTVIEAPVRRPSPTASEPAEPPPAWPVWPANLPADGPGRTLHRWTADEYMKLGDVGIVFGNRTELIGGEIYDVASQNNPHVAGISKGMRVLNATFDESYWITCQSTVRLPTGDVPDPDFTVRPGPASTDTAVQPLPLLAIEVSDTTLLFDQVVKTSMYAASRIQEYWIVNLNDGHVEVYRKPVEDPTRRHGWRYGELTVLRPPDVIAPLAKPDVRIEVARLLP